jgi:hypothetical protein
MEPVGQALAQEPEVQPAPVKFAAAEGVGMAAVEPESPSKAGPSAAPATPTARAGTPGSSTTSGQEALAPLTSARGGADTMNMLYGALSAGCLAMSLVCLLLPGLVSSACCPRPRAACLPFCLLACIHVCLPACQHRLLASCMHADRRLAADSTASVHTATSSLACSMHAAAPMLACRPPRPCLAALPTRLTTSTAS